jgi:hypothetical protein
VLLLLDDGDDAVTLKLLVVKVPELRVTAPEDVNASPKKASVLFCTVTAPTVFPALVIVQIPAITMGLVALYVIPATSVIFPNTVRVALPLKVPVNPVQFKALQVPPPVAIVQVTAPDAASKKTSSAEVGTA